VFSIIHKTQAAFTTGQQTELMVKKKKKPHSHVIFFLGGFYKAKAAAIKAINKLNDKLAMLAGQMI